MTQIMCRDAPIREVFAKYLPRGTVSYFTLFGILLVYCQKAPTLELFAGRPQYAKYLLSICQEAPSLI